MFDNYSHQEYGINYVDENIPGPEETSMEYENIRESFNSQLTHNCKCIEDCLKGDCQCLQISGGENYNLLEQKSVNNKIFILNKKKNVNNFPIIECNDLCNCYKNCGNRLVQNGPLKSLFVKYCNNKLKGLGLFSSSCIPKGTFICEYAGEVITRSQALNRHKHNQAYGKMNYIFCLQEHVNERTIQTFVDPSMFGNIGRYVNHSCESNCEIIPVRVNCPIPKLSIFSLTDIYPNMEITIDYGINSVDSIPENICVRKKCLCESIRCRGLMPYDSY